MGSDDGWIEQVRDAADRAGEPVWPLPLPDDYRKLLDSEIADMQEHRQRRLRRRAHRGLVPQGVRRRRAVGAPRHRRPRAGRRRRRLHRDAAAPGFGVRTLDRARRDLRQALATRAPRRSYGRPWLREDDDGRSDRGPVPEHLDVVLVHPDAPGARGTEFRVALDRGAVCASGMPWKPIAGPLPETAKRVM